MCQTPVCNCTYYTLMGILLYIDMTQSYIDVCVGQKQSIHCNLVYIRDHSPAVLFFFRHCGYIKAKQDPDEEKMQFQHGRGKNNSCTHKQTSVCMLYVCLFLLQMELFQFFTDFFSSYTTAWYTQIHFCFRLSSRISSYVYASQPPAMNPITACIYGYKRNKKQFKQKWCSLSRSKSTPKWQHTVILCLHTFKCIKIADY